MGFLYDTCIAPCCLHRTLNEVREEVNRLEKENDKLKVQNERLEENTKKLKEVEGKLEEISILQGQNVDVLVEQVREFKSIQEQVKVSSLLVFVNDEASKQEGSYESLSVALLVVKYYLYQSLLTFTAGRKTIYFNKLIYL